jgi:hypothetical protein
VWLIRRTTDRDQRRTIAATMIGPVLGIGILLALYNALRFGSPFEFGQKYQLAAYDPTVRSGNKVRYIAPGAWYYLFARPHLTLGFPFVHLQQPPDNYPFHTPSDYDSVEPVSGLFPSVPFVLLAIATPFALRGTARRVNYSLLGIAAAILVVVSFAVWGATMRYEVDFTSYVLVAAGLAWVAAVARTTGVWRRVIAGVGVAFTVWSVVFGLATGMSGYLESLRTNETKTYRRLQVLTSPLPTAISVLSGRPKAVDVWAPAGLEANTGGDAVGHLSFPVGRRALELDVVSGSKRRWGLAMSGQPLETPPKGTHVTIATPATRHAIRMPPEFEPTVVPIQLERGLNRIYISAGGAERAQARLADVHLTEMPPGS